MARQLKRDAGWFRIAVRPDGSWALFEVYWAAGRGWVRSYVGEVA